MDFQNTTTISFIAILIIATSSFALADDSEKFQSLLGSQITDNDVSTTNLFVENVSWVKKVSSDGVIEIGGIKLSILNTDDKSHLFEVCVVIEGPIGKFTPNQDETPACATPEMVESSEKMRNIHINFSKGVKVSDLVDISIIVQEI